MSASEAPFILIYGNSGTGKTTDAVRAFPTAMMIAAPGALKSAMGVLGFEPQFSGDLPDLETIIVAVRRIGAQPTKDKPGGLLIDDLTLYVQRELLKFDTFAGAGQAAWGEIFLKILKLREAGRHAGIPVIMTAHMTTTDGPGRPALPGKKLPFDVPAACDVVLRTEASGTLNTSAGWGWPNTYRCDSTNPLFLTKDRHNVVPDQSPMNLGEILRLIALDTGIARLAPPRLPSLQWQEEYIDGVAKIIIAAGVADRKTAGAALKALQAECLNRDPELRHANWAVEDAWHRAVLRNALTLHRNRFFKF